MHIKISFVKKFRGYNSEVFHLLSFYLIQFRGFDRVDPTLYINIHRSKIQYFVRRYSKC